MSETKQLPTRESLPAEMTWDLTLIFKDDAAFDDAFEALKTKLTEVSEYQGTLDQGAPAFKAAIVYLLDVYRQLETLYVYSHLKNDQDTANSTYQGMYARASSLLAEASEALAWFEPELLTLSDETIWSYFAIMFCNWWKTGPIFYQQNKKHYWLERGKFLARLAIPSPC